MPRLDHLKRFYRLLSTLERAVGGTRQLYFYSGVDMPAGRCLTS